MWMAYPSSSPLAKGRVANSLNRIVGLAPLLEREGEELL
jgi:hypothetical protein